MKVVLDTNVLIDADNEDSAAGKIIDEVLDHKIEAFANRKTLQENKLLATIINNQEHKGRLEHFFEVVQYIEPVRVEAVQTDREDNKIIGSAVAAGADYLITSDWDLLQLEDYEGVHIVRPEDFWNMYRQEIKGENDWDKFVGQFLSHD